MKLKEALLASMLLFSAPLSAFASSPWMTILATEKNLTKGIMKFHALGGKEAGIRIISSNDCSNMRRDYFIIISGTIGSKSEAGVELKKWNARGVLDSYIKECKIVMNSRLDFHVDLIDESIYDKRDTVVNWDYEDALAYTKTLNELIVASVRPRYQHSPEDIREGLKIEVSAILAKTRDKLVLLDDCIDPEFSARSSILAVSCVTATMADHLLHTIYVYRIPNKKPIQILDKCRAPAIVDEHTMVCKKEILDREGNLSTDVTEVSF